MIKNPAVLSLPKEGVPAKNKPLFSFAINFPSPSLLPLKRLPLYRDSEVRLLAAWDAREFKKQKQNTPPSVSFPYLFTFPKFPTLGGLKFLFLLVF